DPGGDALASAACRHIRSRCRPGAHPPRARAGARRSTAIDAASARGRRRYARSEIDHPPRSGARLVERLEPLPVLDRVHRAEEAVVRVRDQLAARDEAFERLLDELVTWFDDVEDLATEDEEPTVDADVGKAHVGDLRDGAVWLRRYEVRIELRF